MTQDQVNEQLRVRFKELPKIVQDAITSADVAKELRKLADTHKLHIDQWQLLENNVMLTLLGLQETDTFAGELKEDLDITEEQAKSLTSEVSRIVFEPIRDKLAQEIKQKAEAHKNAGSGDVSTQAEAHKKSDAIAPTTPPSAPPDGKAVRAPISEAYKPGERSAERRSVDEDPYREPIQ